MLKLQLLKAQETNTKERRLISGSLDIKHAENYSRDRIHQLTERKLGNSVIHVP